MIAQTDLFVSRRHANRVKNEQELIFVGTTSTLQNRISASAFDPEGRIAREDLLAFVELAVKAPSGFNLQPWHFLIIDDKDKKEALRTAAFGQQKITDAAASVIVLANLQAYERAEQIADDLVTKQYTPEAYKEKVISSIRSYHVNSPDKYKEEVIIAASSAAYGFQLAAFEHGYGVTPIGGFDPAAVSETFGIPAHLKPILIIAVGLSPVETKQRKFRFPVEEVSSFNAI
ncbi:nitroreductase family protein [Paenibacillus piri]|uniref:Nitroreductase family protein n=1 Tax=Paenibacillus piri TaxID=2547395 RepID=A0A4R5KCK6_9BACL|nr:nitroreductase family protein [Paenibacillus piri]TDF93001.1 nitroreductase family protein [Paenibacillus piri]